MLEHDELAHRRRRAGVWRAATVAVHLLLPALTVVLLLAGSIAQPEALVITVTLAVAPVAVAWWLEQRRPSAGKPQQWALRSSFVAFPQAIALVFAVNGVLDEDTLNPWQRILLVVAVTLVPAMTATLARRSLLRPLVPALGTGDFDVLVEPRSAHRPWFYGDSITLTDREVVISVRSGAGRATWNPKVRLIALEDITAVSARAAVPQDSPWVTLSDGRGLSVPPGDVVVLECRHGGWVLPVEDAAVFAEMIRVRARAAELTVAAGTTAPETPDGPAAGHLPEVLPAPEPTGPPAHPVTGPAGPVTSGPGMAVRSAVGYPLALLGIVGVPVGLLVWGGLLAAAPGLERYRLVFCLLWTALAAGIWLRSWQQPRYWPVWALASSLGTAIIVAGHAAELAALLAPIAGVLLTWAGRQVLLRPVGTDLAGSRLEVPLRAGGVTLLVQHDRVVLKLRAGAGGAVPQAMPLNGVTVVQPGQVARGEVTWWPYPGARRLPLGRGPVLRLVSGCQQWLLPTPVARELAAIIRARVTPQPRPQATATLSTDRSPTVAEWQQLQSWAVQQLTTTDRHLKQRTVGWRLVVAIPAAFLGSALLTESIARGAGPGTGFPVVAGLALALAALLGADWIRVRRRLRVAEDNPLPPGSPAWGEVRPGHAPLPSWQPWHE